MRLRWKIAQAAEIRWWQKYLKGKPKADYLDWKRKYWNDLLQKLDIRLTAGETNLDAGCGPAGVFIVLNQNKVDALDPLLDQYESKLAHFHKGDYPWTRFFHQPLEDFSPTEPYDKVFCFNAINHVADLDLCFDKLVESTSNGGQLIVSIDAHNISFFKHLFRIAPGDILHPHQFDLEEYKAMLEKRGCVIEQELKAGEGFFFDYYVLVAKKREVVTS